MTAVPFPPTDTPAPPSPADDDGGGTDYSI